MDSELSRHGSSGMLNMRFCQSRISALAFTCGLSSGKNLTSLTIYLLVPLLLAAIALVALQAWAAGQPTTSVWGVVVSQAGKPLAGAHVRVRATDNLTYTLSDGRFTLTGLTSGVGSEVAAWASGGYYIASQVITPPISGITLTLRPYHRGQPGLRLAGSHPQPQRHPPMRQLPRPYHAPVAGQRPRHGSI
jgi:hypothetical protein